MPLLLDMLCHDLKGTLTDFEANFFKEMSGKRLKEGTCEGMGGELATNLCLL
jgi:hypothetical protein